jgi:sialidase-1
MDSLLLSKGLYVAYISVDDQYGSPYAMRVWDKFYNYLVDSLSFAAKVSLEGVSRGGLYMYGWAKRNPDKVNCIYGEAPVCDFKSWPGGRGKGVGNASLWGQLLRIYSMSEREALDYKDNPIDNLEGLAAFKVPIIHIIGMSDKVVPPAENTFLLVQRYMSLGGPSLVYPVTHGPFESNGHHFPIPHADWWADCIFKNVYPVTPPLPYNEYFNIRNGLKNSYRVIVKSKKATVGFLGGPITFNPGWRDKVGTYLKERFPETDFRFINGGNPSPGGATGILPLQKGLLDSGKIDLLFVETSVNDRMGGKDSISQARSLEGIISQAKKSNPLMDMVLMSFADSVAIKDYDNGIRPAEVSSQELAADHCRLPSINLAKEIRDKLNHREFGRQYDFKDVHHTMLEQELYFETIKKLLMTCYDTQVVSSGEENSGADL